MSDYWGYHLILDCKACNIDRITSYDNIKSFITSLVRDIDMVAYGTPVIEHFATHDPMKAGYSLVQLIETSSITGHFVDLTGDCYLDIFSCKEFNIETVIRCVESFFNPDSIRRTYLTRQA